MTEHDIPLSAIVTSGEIIEIDTAFPRPKGIYWRMLPPDKIEAIPILKVAVATRVPVDKANPS